MGWHVSSDEDWKKLETYLGIDPNEIDKFTPRGTDESTRLKSSTLWPEESKGTDEVGFNALPAGYRNMDGNFYYLNSITGWWTGDMFVEAGIYRDLSDLEGIGRGRGNPLNGLIVKCVKNE